MHLKLKPNHSPIDGTVSKLMAKPSELVAMGVPIVSIIQDRELWVSLNNVINNANIHQAKQNLKALFQP